MPALFGAEDTSANKTKSNLHGASILEGTTDPKKHTKKKKIKQGQNMTGVLFYNGGQIKLLLGGYI